MNKLHLVSIDAIERIKSEILIHLTMDHPSIVKMYCVFEDDQYMYLVMELCENGDVHSYYARCVVQNSLHLPTKTLN